MDKTTLTTLSLLSMLLTAGLIINPSEISLQFPLEQVILDKHDQKFVVVPGTTFCFDRTLKAGFDRDFGLAYTPGATLISQRIVHESIEFYNETIVDKRISHNFTYETTCHDNQTNSSYPCNKTEIRYNITYKKVLRNRTIETFEDIHEGSFSRDKKLLDSKEKEFLDRIDQISTKEKKFAKYEKFAFSKNFSLSKDTKIRSCFRVPAWGSGEPMAGSISSLSGDDYETTVWWNSSYSSRRDISCTNMDDGVPLVINGSGGFDIGGGKNIVWTYCSGSGTSLYYNDYTDYVVANDTTQLPMEVEMGNGTSYNPTQVWNSNFKGVWHFKETGTATRADSTSNINDGTPYNGVAGADGKINGANDFDGTDDYVDVNDSASLNITDEITIEAWINPSALESDDHNIVVKGEWTSSSEMYRNYQFMTVNDELRFVYTNPSGSSSTYHYSTTDAANLVVGNWYYVAVTFDPNTDTLKHYVNGEEKTWTGTNTPEASTMQANIYPLTFGCMLYPSPSHFFNGIIDEVRVLNVSLSASEINQTYQNAIGTSGYGDLGAEETNTVPTISQPTIYPTTLYTDTNVNATTIATDAENITLQIEYYWCVNGVEKLSGNISATNNTLANIPELGSGNFSTGDTVNVTVRAWDGALYSNYNSSTKTVSIHSLEGKVQDNTGNIIAGARVVIVSQATNQSVGTVVTNSTGQFSYTPSTSGNYSICAWNPSNITLGGDCTPFVEVP